MGSRRQARENALQILYQLELSGSPLEEVKETFWGREVEVDPSSKAFVNQLVDGVVQERENVDKWIEQYSSHWRLSRMPAVDKNILRLAIFEMQNCKEIPLKVTLNEAIEIAKKFGSEESGAFVNGVLDRIAKEIRKDE